MSKKSKAHQKKKSPTGKSAFAPRPMRRSFFDFQNPKFVASVSAVLFVVVAGIYFPTVKGAFLYFDEHSYIVTNPHVNTGLSWQNIVWAISSLQFSNWYPVTWMSHMLDVQVYGMNPWGHHLTNILIHAVNTALVFLVFYKLTGAGWRSVVIAGLFGLHPLRVESVAWISERKDVLSTMFWLLAMWAYVRFVHELKKEKGRKKLFYALTLIFFALGLASKTMLVTLPFVFLLLDFWPLKRWEQPQKWKLIVEKIPFFLLTAGVSYLSYLAQKRGGMTGELPTLALSQKVDNAIVSYVRYLGKFFWPENLCVFYQYQFYWPKMEVIGAALLLIAIAVAAFLLRRTRPYFLVGWFWYLGTFVPVINLVQLGSQAMADRYTYVPMMGIYLLLAWGLFDLTKSWRRQTFILATASTAVLIICAALTRFEIQFWKDDVSVWERAVDATKNNFMALNNLGIVMESVDNDKALAIFEKAVAINPLSSGAQQNLGDQYVIHGRYAEAIVHYENALQIDPNSDVIEYGLGIALTRNKQSSEAAIHLQRAVDMDPSNSIHQNTLGVVLFQLGQTNAGFQCFQKAVASNPADYQAQFDLGMALLKLGRTAESIAPLQAAIKLEPDFKPAHDYLNTALEALGQTNSPPAQ